jgi:hypothetical protein
MKLSTWNWIAAGVHGFSAIVLSIYFLAEKGNINFNTDLYDFRIKLKENEPENSEISAKKATRVTLTTLKTLLIVYFLFTTFFHILYATDCFKTGAYSRALASQNNYFRWVEYAISSTIMTFLIAIITGTKCFDVVLLLIFMNICMIATGQIVEASKSFSDVIIALSIGWFLLVGIVTVFFKSFFTALQDGKDNDFKIPSWVYFVIFPLVLWYASFGFVSLWQVFGKYTPQRYLTIEKAYIVLSLISKVNLGYVIAFGLSRPKADKN